MIPKMFTERRLARFYVPDIVRRDFPYVWMEILKGKVITRAEFLLAENAIDYVAYGNDFPPTPEGSAPQNHDLNIHIVYVQLPEGKMPTSVKWHLEPHKPSKSSIHITLEEDKSELARRYYVEKNGSNNNKSDKNGESSKSVQS